MKNLKIIWKSIFVITILTIAILLTSEAVLIMLGYDHTTPQPIFSYIGLFIIISAIFLYIAAFIYYIKSITSYLFNKMMLFVLIFKDIIDWIKK